MPLAPGGVADIFDQLESNKDALQIKHFSVSQTTLDEVRKGHWTQTSREEEPVQGFVEVVVVGGGGVRDGSEDGDRRKRSESERNSKEFFFIESEGDCQGVCLRGNKWNIRIWQRIHELYMQPVLVFFKRGKGLREWEAAEIGQREGFWSAKKEQLQKHVCHCGRKTKNGAVTMFLFLRRSLSTLPWGRLVWTAYLLRTSWLTLTPFIHQTLKDD